MSSKGKGTVEVKAVRWIDPITGKKHRRGNILENVSKDYEKLAADIPDLIKYVGKQDEQEKEV